MQNVLTLYTLPVYVVVTPVRFSNSLLVIFCCNLILRMETLKVVECVDFLLTRSTFCYSTVGYWNHTHDKQSTLCGWLPWGYPKLLQIFECSWGFSETAVDLSVHWYVRHKAWSKVDKAFNIFNVVCLICLSFCFLQAVSQSEFCACWWKRCLKVFCSVRYRCCIICKKQTSYSTSLAHCFQTCRY